MINEFIPYTEALALKELGFNETCFATFFSVGAWQIDCVEGSLNLKSNTSGEYSILAPLYQQAFRWFRKNHHLDSWVKKGKNDDYIFEIYGWGKDSWDSHEEAELECLKKLIEIVKEQKS